MRGSIAVAPGTPWRQRLLRFAGPGLLVAVGDMDPGHWATDIEAGSVFGYSLPSVVPLSSLAAIVLQVLALRLGIAGDVGLARACRRRHGTTARDALWAMAEVAIVACDVAEVLGSAQTMLVAGQVVLSLQLPFAIWPLVRLTSDRAVMGSFANGPGPKFVAWSLFAVISAANLGLLAAMWR